VRRRLFGLAFGLALTGLAGTAAAQVQSLTAEEAGNLIRFESSVRVVLIYSTTCKPSHQMFPEVVRLAERYSPLGVRFLAFAIDRSPDDIDGYLASMGYPFERLHIRPWQPGELIAALAPSGIDVRRQVATPHIAVIDADGHLVGQRQDGWGARNAERWLRSLGLRPAAE
jgi:thiol-disulfide isomerase/thioredoxin